MSALVTQLFSSIDPLEPNLIVVPSTWAYIETAAKEKGERCLIGDIKLMPGALTPSQYLAQCAAREARGQIAQCAIIFTDQLVEPHVTPFLVQHGEKLEFLSSIEVLASTRYSVDLQIWMGRDWAIIPATEASRNQLKVLRALLDYLEACKALGSEWIVENRQWQRAEQARRKAGLARARYYASYLMQSSPNAPLTSKDMSILKELGACRAGLLQGYKEASA